MMGALAKEKRQRRGTNATRSVEAGRLLEKAVAHHQGGRLAAATKGYQAVLAIDPRQSDALHLSGVIAHQEGHSREALTLIEEAISINPDSAAYYNNLSAILLAMGEPNRAAEQLEIALRLQPDYADALKNLGRARARTSEHQAALSAFDRCLALRPKDAECLHERGLVLKSLGRLDEAAVGFRAALAIDAGRLDSGYLLAICLGEIGDAAAAVAACKQNLSMQPKHWPTHKVMGLILLNMGRLEEAEESLGKAAALGPVDAQVENGIAGAAMARKDYSRAISHLRKALEEDRDFYLAWNNLGISLLESDEEGQSTEAVDCFVKACDANPSYAAAQGGLIEALVKASGSLDDRALDDHLARAFGFDYVRHQRLSVIAARHLRRKYQAQWLELESWLAKGGEAASTCPVEGFTTDPILLGLLAKTINTDSVLERLFTGLRRHLLSLAGRGLVLGPETLRLMVAIARQTYGNGFVWQETSAESDRIDAIGPRLDSGEGTVEEAEILGYAMYRPLVSLAGLNELADRVSDLPAALGELVNATLVKDLQERRLKDDIPCLTPVSTAVSREVQSQYEESPYPRWLSLAKTPAVDFRQDMGRAFPHLDLQAFPASPHQVLVAGCGTGQHPIGRALGWRELNVLAVDLSRSSLAYAARMAGVMGAQGVSFAQADILELGRLDRRFHIIECAGVLHHMQDPEAGLEVLLGLLHPGGLMRLGLYSERARAVIVAARKRIAALGLKPTPADIKSFRQRVLSGEEKEIQARLIGLTDFHDLNGCRDLLFNVVEHRYTPLTLKQILSRHGLEFVGFELENKKIGKRYRERYPGDHPMNDLDCWEEFEADFPDSFVSMYQFWCRKSNS